MFNIGVFRVKLHDTVGVCHTLDLTLWSSQLWKLCVITNIQQI